MKLLFYCGNRCTALEAKATEEIVWKSAETKRVYALQKAVDLGSGPETKQPMATTGPYHPPYSLLT